jgi:hypothetical protein
VKVPAAGVLKMFTALFPGHSLAGSEDTRRVASDAVDATKMLPVFVNRQGELIDDMRRHTQS